MVERLMSVFDVFTLGMGWCLVCGNHAVYITIAFVMN